MTIKWVIFDLGGVIFTNDSHFMNGNDEFSSFFKLTKEEMSKGWLAGWPKYRVGEISEDEFWQIYLIAANAKDIDIKKAKQLWRKYQFEIENMLALLVKLKKNCKLASLTNIGKEWLDFKKEKFKLGNYFEEIVSSGYSGVAKPNREIYDLILTRLNAKPTECVYIDDNEETLKPATGKGMHTILFKGQKSLEEALNKIAIKF
ncbi:MAG: HAD family phosphatase [archaeon]|nr:HAD family phosphatase [archaeon]